MKCLSLFLLIVIPFLGLSQQDDSLYGAWKNKGLPDSLRYEAMSSHIWSLFFVDPDSSETLANEQLEYAVSTKNFEQEADAYNSLGISYTVRGQNNNAVKFFTKSLNLNVKLGNRSGEGAAYNNIGMVYNNKGDFYRAISYYERSLKIDEELQDFEGMAAVLGNIGNIYVHQEEYEKGIEYHERSLKLDLANEDKRGVADTYNNLSVALKEQERYEEAEKYAMACLKEYQEMGESHGQSLARDNLGAIYQETDRLDEALEQLELSLELKKSIDDRSGIAQLSSNFGFLFTRFEEYDKAIDWCNEGLRMSDSLEVLIFQKENCLCLYEAWRAKDNTRKALEYYERYIQLEDSTVNETNLTALISNEFRFNYEKDKLKDSIATVQEIEIHKEQVKYEKKQKYWLWAGLALVGVMGLLAYRSFRLKKRDNQIITEQKKEVERQKLIVEEKNAEITDSITYAKRLQEAILPPRADLLAAFPKHCLLYLPKDIVAGDFYWMHRKANYTFVAVADCTGHGVPGAMVSVICSDALNRAVKEFELTETGAILDKVTDLVIERFAKSGEDVRDGMDIALARINFRVDGAEIQYSGANNSLMLLTEKGSEILETKGDKQPIGLYGKRTPFISIELAASSGDRIYLSSDGYPDQFGGEKGKKMKSVNFKKLLVNSRNIDLSSQEKVLKDYLVNWMGDLEQIDDVCVFGFQL